MHIRNVLVGKCERKWRKKQPKTKDQSRGTKHRFVSKILHLIAATRLSMFLIRTFYMSMLQWMDSNAFSIQFKGKKNSMTHEVKNHKFSSLCLAIQKKSRIVTKELR